MISKTIILKDVVVLDTNLVYAIARTELPEDIYAICIYCKGTPAPIVQVYSTIEERDEAYGNIIDTVE